MLKKLLKYEIKATARFFLPLYAALLVFSLINRLLNPFGLIASSNNFNLQVIISILSITAYFALMIGTLAMTVIIMIQRFYKNLLGDEGYLMFTLPIKTWQHVISKLLVAMMWTVLSFLVTIGSIVIIANIESLKDKLIELVNAFENFFGTTGFFAIPLYILLMIAFYTVMVYTAIALGHLFEKHKLVASFGMFCVLYFVYQIISAVFILVSSKTIFSFINDNWIPTPYELNAFILTLSLLSVAFTAINFTLTNTILQKRLNLE